MTWECLETNVWSILSKISFYFELNSKELETEKSKNEQMRMQINALQASSLSRDVEKMENQVNRNKSLEKHLNESEENVKNLNNLLTQERAKVLFNL